MKRNNRNAMTSKLLVALLLLAILASGMLASCSGRAQDEAPGYRQEMPMDNEQSKVFSSDVDGFVSNSQSANESQKLIKTVSMTAETKEFDTAVDAIGTMIQTAGGYIEKQDMTGISYGYSGVNRRRLSLTARIPKDKLDAFTADLSDALNVTQLSSNVENVTEAYYSAEERLKTLKTERDSLLAMMDSLNKAEDYEFWYTLEKRVSELEQDIAVLEGTVRNYDSRVDYSTVNLSLDEVIELTDTTTEEPTTYGGKLKESFVESWKSFGNGWADFFLWLIEAFPTLLILGGIGVGIFFIIRGIVRKAKKKRASR